MAEIAACLYFHAMRYDPRNPKDPDRDRFLLSKGHCVLIQYAALAELGVVPRAELEAEALRMARTIAVMDSGAVRLTKEAINRAADIMGLPQALEAGVDLAVQVETLDTPERREFDAIRRRDGLKAALAWRDARFARPGPAGRSEGTE